MVTYHDHGARNCLGVSDCKGVLQDLSNLVEWNCYLVSYPSQHETQTDHASSSFIISSSWALFYFLHKNSNNKKAPLYQAATRIHEDTIN
jgi:hypothetical protein